MVDWSQGSAHPDQGASTIAAASTARPVYPGVDALADLAALLADPSTRAWALSAVDGGRDNQAVKRASGSAADLIRDSDSSWAIVVQPAPDLLVFDLDECADVVLPALCDAVEEAASEVLAIVDSGRDNCRHLWIAPATAHARKKIVDDARWLRAQHLLSADQVDERSGKTIRLPGSASLKATGGRARIVDADGQPLAPADAYTAARSAMARIGRVAPTSNRSRNAVVTQRPWPRAKKKHSKSRPTVTPPLPLEANSEHGRPVVETPRAWRRRTKLDSESWAILNDADSEDRSAAATAGAWVLFRQGVRSFALARWWYENLPCFDKFRHRDETRASTTSSPNQWESCRQHWETIRDRGVNHVRPMSAEDQAVVDGARQAVSTWNDPLLQAAGLVVIERRFATGHGVTGRPIARRDLQLWLHLADGTSLRPSSAPGRGAPDSLHPPLLWGRGEVGIDLRSAGAVYP